VIGKLRNTNKETTEEVELKIHESVPFAILLAIVGGLLDAYTFIGRGGVFANAQTGNIVLFGVYAAQGDWKQAFIHVPPIAAFVAGVLLAEAIKNRPAHFFISDWERVVLILEMAVLIAVGFIPYSVSDNVVTVTISFVTSIQVSSFRRLVDSPYASTISTGNLRTASHALYFAVTQKDRAAAIRSVRFFAIIASFLSGAFLGGLLTVEFAAKAVWGAAIILIIPIMMLSVYRRPESK
jgi:uncharacterized membrane protein YoaK (UPF0700 family)